MRQIIISHLQRTFGEVKSRIHREPLEITRNGHRELVLLTGDDYDWLVAAAKRTNDTQNAPDFIKKSVRQARMSPEHDHLNSLLD